MPHAARLASSLASLTLLTALAPAVAAEIEYNRDIRPILSENCFSCHGPDSASRKADLRLDQRDAAIAAGAITPGKPDESEFIRRILSNDADELMPPASSHKSLTAGQKDLLKRWVAQDAVYQPHWSFLPPVKAAPPAVKNEGWVRNPIDRFVLAKLEENGLAPAPEADRRTLARRAALDLTGLPPKPEMVDAFVNDQSPDAYERYVDRLLQSETWGEHRARYWLDAARYADTHGIHFDNFREMWSYRDQVIRAFNANQPFDQFTIEQLAGDLLPDRTVQQQVASGFNRCNITTNEGGTIAEEYLVLYTRDRTETTSQVWLGLTTGCAVCHDHKFDPISQKEFYQLAAFFNNSTQGAMDGNIKDTPPIITLPRDEDAARWEQLPAELAAARQQVEERKKTAAADFEQWLKTLDKGALAQGMPASGLLAQASFEAETAEPKIAVNGQEQAWSVANNLAWETNQPGGPALRVTPQTDLQATQLGDFEKDQAFTVSAWVRLPRVDGTGAILARMDEGSDYRGWDVWVENGKIGMHVVNKWPSNALKAVTKNSLAANTWYHLTVSYDGLAKPDSVRVSVNGQAEAMQPMTQGLTDTIRTGVPLKIGQRNQRDRLTDLQVREVRLYSRLLTPDETVTLATVPRILDLLEQPPAPDVAQAEKQELQTLWSERIDAVQKANVAKAKALEEEQGAIKARGTIAHVVQEKPSPAMAFVLARGDYDKRKDQVEPGTPAALPAFPADLPRNRLGFAQWLLRPEHPLTARVTVNRFWQEVFGTGLVRTTGDFGITGELPSHPELLDWLAVDFRENGWDVKRAFRQIVTSATYRQAAITTPEKLEKDRANKLLSRGPRFRMDAEMIRDGALAASGLLVQKLGGPSVKPYQPEGVWEAVAMPESNTKRYQADQGEGLYRRSLYTFWKRAAPPASMDIFNAPSREICTVRRERTNTPLQALVTLNDPQFMEAAQALAVQYATADANRCDGQCDALATRVLARPLTAEERTIVRGSLESLGEYYKAHPEEATTLVGVYPALSKKDGLEPPTLAAWTMLANELLNLDEVLNK